MKSKFKKFLCCALLMINAFSISSGAVLPKNIEEHVNQYNSAKEKGGHFLEKWKEKLYNMLKSLPSNTIEESIAAFIEVLEITGRVRYGVIESLISEHKLAKNGGMRFVSDPASSEKVIALVITLNPGVPLPSELKLTPVLQVAHASENKPHLTSTSGLDMGIDPRSGYRAIMLLL